MPKSPFMIKTKLGGFFWTSLVAIFALALALFLIASQISSGKMVQVRQGWQETLGSWDEIMERFPSRQANEAALELERLSATVGIDIATRSAEERDRPSREDARSFKRVKAEIGAYLKSQIERSRRGPGPPPSKVAAYLEEHAADLEAIRRHVLSDPAPRWEMQLERLYEAPIPNLLGHIDLQKLMIVDALVSSWRKDTSGALAGLEASWRLNRALREDPFLITQLVAMNIARMRAGALRQIEGVPESWSDLLFEHDFRESFLTAMLIETWLWTHIDGPSIFDTRPGGWQKLVWTVARPYANYCLADLSEDYRRRLAILAETDALCDYDLSARRADLDVPVPAWNLIGGLVVPNLLGSLDRLARLELDLELTGKLLQLEDARRRGGGGWPLAPASIEQSSVCPRDRWVYRVAPDGSMSIAFSRDLSWPDQVGAILPTSYASGP